MIRCLISLLGFLYVLKHAKDLVLLIYNYLFGAKRDLLALYGPGSYALVTGGSDGIGKQFALQLAQRGFNLILVSRSPENLEKAKKEIVERHPSVKVVCVPFDFTKFKDLGSEGVEKLMNIDLSAYDVSVLVNNVGLARRGTFEQNSIAEIQSMVNVNCLPQALLSAHFAKLFARRKGRSCIINLASLGAVKSLPFYELYGGTKRFNYHLSHSMNGFYDRLDLYTYMPGHCKTKMTSFKEGWARIEPELAVEAAMRSVGGCRHVFHGHWKHELMGYLYRTLPETLLQNFVLLNKENFIKKKE